MKRYTVPVSQFGYYVVDAESPEAAIAAAWDLLEDRIDYHIDGTDMGEPERASKWEPVTR